jgi:hypothetical protein
MSFSLVSCSNGKATITASTPTPAKVYTFSFLYTSSNNIAKNQPSRASTRYRHTFAIHKLSVDFGVTSTEDIIKSKIVIYIISLYEKALISGKVTFL